MLTGHYAVWLIASGRRRAMECAMKLRRAMKFETKSRRRAMKYAM
jgi:hypothetical protein